MDINLKTLINYLPDLPFLKESLAQLTPDFLAQSAVTMAPAISTFLSFIGLIWVHRAATVDFWQARQP